MSLYSFSNEILNDSDVEVNMTREARSFFHSSIYNFRSDNFAIPYEYIHRLAYRFFKIDSKRFKSTYYLDQFLLGRDPIELLKIYANNVSEEYILETFNNFKSNKTFLEILTENLLAVFTLGTHGKRKFDSIDYLTDKYKIDLMNDEQLDGFNKAVILYLMFDYNLEKSKKISNDFQQKMSEILNIKFRKFGIENSEYNEYDFLNDSLD